MRLDQNSIYKTVITPWYDSNSACHIMLFFLGMVLIFAGVGIWVAMINFSYEPYLWFPVTLAGVSFFVMVKTSFRLLNRNRNS